MTFRLWRCFSESMQNHSRTPKACFTLGPIPKPLPAFWEHLVSAKYVAIQNEDSFATDKTKPQHLVTRRFLEKSILEARWAIT